MVCDGLTEIIEGSAKIYVDKTSFEDIPEHASIFYNPVMKFDRDISVEIIREYFKDKENVVGLDLLSATGIRGIRYLLESNVDNIVLNDISSFSYEIIKKNVELNNLSSRSKIYNLDANKLLNCKLENMKFDFIDIDPFGPPSPFFESSLKRIKRNGLILITATDRGALCGKYNKAGLRKYSVFLGKTSFPNDIALRALIASINLSALRLGKCVEPIFSYSRRHYYRVYLIVREGSRFVKNTFKNLGFVEYNEKTDEREINSIEFPKGFGPIWIGKLNNREKLANIKNRFVLNVLNELDVPFYYDLSYLSKIHKQQMKKKMYFIDRLKEIGYKATTTHLCDQGIKTNAPLKEIIKILKE